MTEPTTGNHHLALARRWRPSSFSSVVGQSQVLQALSNALDQQRLHHAYLFTGTRGVGKTSIARILAKCLNCETGITSSPCGKCPTCLEIDSGRFPDLYEIDAASRTKVEDTREILDNVQYAPTSARYKIYLIDEVHMLSGHSFNALLKTLEEPPEHVKFLLATTDPQKLPATVLSRCLQFHLHQLAVEQISDHLAIVLTKENISAEPEALQLLAQAAKGSMRDGLSLLDQAIAFCNGNLTTQAVRDMLGSIAPNLLYDLITALCSEDGKQVLALIQQLNQLGCDFSQALSELLSVLHHIATEQVVPNADSSNDSIKQLAKTINKETLQLYYQIGLHGQRDLPYAPTPRSAFEMTLLRMLAFTPQAADTVTSVGSTTIATTTASTVATNSDWTQLFKQLKLSGTAGLLASHCSQAAKTDDEITLLIERKHQPLLQETNIKRIQEAVQKLLNKPIKVSIKVGEAASLTPAAHSKKQSQQRQQQARQDIYNDDKVQEIIKTFDAKVIEESITPNNET